MNHMKRIAMWSGPRNLSTTLMRSFGARSDTVCVDEPFYAAYLKATGLNHPMRDAILAAHEGDAARVAESLSQTPCDAPVQYQKHMAHHMIDGLPRAWMGSVRHVFLIRHPARVIASFTKKAAELVSLEAIGFPLQWELFEAAEALTGTRPLVVDSDEILRDPKTTLTRLCAHLDLEFEASMLSWAPGPKPEDGAWAPHWYDAVWKSSGFGSPPGELPQLPDRYHSVLTAALPYYEKLTSLAA